MNDEKKCDQSAPKLRVKRILETLFNHPIEATKEYSHMIQNKLASFAIGYPVPYPEHHYERYFRAAKGGTVVDVGAHIGLFAVSVAKRVGKVIAIEPEPRNFMALRRNVRNLSNVLIVRKAAWDARARLPLFLRADGWGHTLVPDDMKKQSTIGEPVIEIEADTLDSILSRLDVSEVDFMKMDIEGAEIEALEGARQILMKTSKIVVASYHTRKGVRTAEAVKGRLADAGFRLFEDPHGLVYGLR